MNKMPLESQPNAAARECLSALVDGEVDPSSAARACSHWRDDAEARCSWHAYQLIGDVLRSVDLACHRDAEFLAVLRMRLQAEPFVLAPNALGPVTSGRAGSGWRVAANRRWAAPAAMAAAVGFVALTVVLVGSGNGGLSGSAPPPALALAAPDAGANQAASPKPELDRVLPVTAADPGPVDAEPAAIVADRQLIRSVRLDRYLAAHKQFSGSSALGLPSAYWRDATAIEAGH